MGSKNRNLRASLNLWEITNCDDVGLRAPLRRLPRIARL